MKNQIWVVAYTDFPNGLGSTTRIKSICSGIIRAGYKPLLLIPYAIGHSRKGNNNYSEGNFNSIKFKYFSGSTSRPSNLLSIIYYKISANLKIALDLLINSKRIKSIFLYNMSYLDCWQIIISSKIKKIPIILDLTDEWYDPSLSSKVIGIWRYIYQKISRLLENLLYVQVDKIITVSTYFIKKLSKFKNKTVLLPVIFDFSRFIVDNEKVRLAENKNYIMLYAGNISEIEGIKFAITALKALTNITKKIRLVLIGDTTQNDRLENYKKLSRKLNIEDYIIFHPIVSSADYPKYLLGADLLIVPRTNCLFSKAGFPYKLVEYMATGVPVLVTRFGDVTNYFQDGVDCFMCEAENIKDFTKKVVKIMNNPSLAEIVSHQGQKKVVSLFSIDIVAKKIRDIIE